MKLIYKYREWKVPQKTILTNNCLWFPSVKTLRKIDPDELTNYVDFTKVPEEERIQYFVGVSERLNEGKSRAEIHQEAINMFVKEKASNWKTYNSMGEVYGKTFATKVGICSFSSNYDIAQQWENYAGNFFGICIGFDLEKLQKHFGRGHGGIIRYKQELDHPASTFNLIEDAFVTHCTKLNKYSDEEEHRYLLMDPSLSVDEEYQDKGEVLPEYVYNEIIVGHKLLENDAAKTELFGILEKRFLHCEKFSTLITGNKILKVPIGSFSTLNSEP